nr:flavin reductase family protein [Agrobacterium tumefaciens]
MRQHASGRSTGHLDCLCRPVEGTGQISGWRLASVEDGLPYLTDAQASLFCTLEQKVPFGTHNIFIGTVNRVLISETISPLLYEDGKYARSMAIA